MITASYGLTATERVLPRLALDWTTGLAQPGVDVTRAGVATFVGSNGLIQPASINTQRVDYSTGTAGLLVEESRINLTTYSNTFSNAAWSKLNSSVGAFVISPDGTANAVELVDNATNGAHTFERSNVVTVSGAVYTFSVFAKANSLTKLILQLDGNNTVATSSFDLSLGTITTTDGGTATIQSGKDGWYRCIVSGTTVNTAPYLRIRTVNAAGAGSYAGTGQSLYVYGAQLEAGAFPTSYIPTTIAAVTRNADAATMTGTNFSDWYNPTEGTFSIDCIINTKPAGQILIEMRGGTSANRFQYQRDSSSNTLRYLSIVSSSITVNLTKTSTFVNDVASITSAYKLNNYGVAVNGGVTTTDTSGGVPVVDRMRIGATVAGTAPSSGWYQKLLYYPQRLTNAEIQAFSK
jgi:hypothetical protein